MIHSIVSRRTKYIGKNQVYWEDWLSAGSRNASFGGRLLFSQDKQTVKPQSNATSQLKQS